MVSYISASINTRWHLDTQKRGGLPTESEHTPKRTETEFSQPPCGGGKGNPDLSGLVRGVTRFLQLNYTLGLTQLVKVL